MNKNNNIKNGMLKMKRNTTQNPVKLRKRTDKFLKDLTLYEAYIEYYTKLKSTDKLTIEQTKTVTYRLDLYSTMTRAARRAIENLTPTERRIIELLYFTPETNVDDTCDIMAMERSTVYRYRASALDKLTAQIFGKTTR